MAREGTIDIFVNVWGRHIQFVVPPRIRIERILQVLDERNYLVSSRVEGVELFLNRRALKRDRRISDYGILDGAVLNLHSPETEAADQLRNTSTLIISVRFMQNTLSFKVKPSTTSKEICRFAAARFSMELSGCRFLYEFEPFGVDERCVRDWKLKNGGIIYLNTIPTLRGDIGQFSASKTSDPLINYLMVTDEERQNMKLPLEPLKRKAAKEGAISSSTFSFEPKAKVLDSIQSKLLCNFLEFMWESQDATQKPEIDMKVILPKTNFCNLLCPLDGEVAPEYGTNSLLKTFQQLFEQVPGASSEFQIVLRMTRGPTKSCLAFHCDSSNSTSTTQVALNDPSTYEGGRLCFFVQDKVHILEREVGSVVQHPPTVLHGVTNLTHGTRKSLFLIDVTNNIGDKDVFKVTEKNINDFRSGVGFDSSESAPPASCGYLDYLKGVMHENWNTVVNAMVN